MIYGYIRVSTKSQEDNSSLNAQREQVLASGAIKVFEDVGTGTDFDREGFKALEEVLKPGDTLIVTKLDRFARSTEKGVKKIQELADRGVTINILNMGIADTKTSTGRLMLNILLSFAEYERDCIVERMREGKAIARLSKDFKEGRPAVHKNTAKDHALELLKTHTIKEVVAKTGISKATIMRHQAKVKAEAIRKEKEIEGRINR